MIYKSRAVITAENGAELGTHGTSILPVAAYDNDYTKREAIWHWHRELELIYVVKGSVLVTIPNEQFILNTGETAFINSGVMHSASNGGEGECIFHSAVFLPEFLCNGPEGIFWKKYLCPLIENSGLRSVCFSGDPEKMKIVSGYMEEFWKACQKEPLGFEFYIREYLSRILCCIISEYRNIEEPESPGHRKAGERVKTMLAYVHENYASEITVRTLASCASISSSECLRCFKEILGTTPVQYVKKYRLQLAADMLVTTDHTVTEIAGRCGFGHMSYFSRAFAQLFGVTPREYRGRQGKYNEV